MFNRLLPAVLTATTLLLPLAASAQTTYNGNGATGFGGVLGNGSLSVSSTTTSATDGTITFTFHPATGTAFNDGDFVVYIDSQTGGLTDTSSLVDYGDIGRQSISGYSGGNPANSNQTNRTQVNFAPTFGADYAISFENNVYTGVFSMPSPGNNYLNYITGQAPTSGGPYTVTVTDAQLGLTPGSSFNIVGTFISSTVYRSNETLGTSVTVPGTVGDTPNAGFNGTTTFANFDTYTTAAPAAAPEPSGMVSLVVGMAALGSIIVARRRNARII